MHFVQSHGEPLMLACPISLILGIRVIQGDRDSAVLTCRQFFPIERKTQLALDLILLCCQQMKECLCLVTRNIEFGSNLFFGANHDRIQRKVTSPDAIGHPGLQLRFLSASNWPT